MEEEIEIGVNEAIKLLEDEQWITLDVRHNFERSSGFLPGQHIPLEDLNNRSAELTKEKNIMVYCRCGNRSLTAIKQLRTLGFEKQLVHLQGGIMSVRKAERKKGIKLIQF